MGDATFGMPVVLPANPTSAMHAATKQYVDGATSGGTLVPLPAGSVTTYAGASPPNGWLLCNGQAVGRTAYAALYAAIGTTFGAGDGSTTFNVPDLRGRVAAGLDNMGGSDAGRLDWANTLGTAGGAQNHTLSIAELASHGHGGATGTDSPDHSHYVNPNGAHTHGLVALTNTTTTGSGRRITGGSGTIGDATASGGSHDHSTNGASARHAHGISNDGGGQAHNNMQPTMLLNYIISTGAGIAAPTTATVTVSGTAPTSPANGDLWVDTSTPAWIAPTLLNSWVNFGSGYNNAGYMKDSLGFVVLRGLIKSGTLGAAAFTLPSGYRPVSGTHIFPHLSNNAIIRIDVDTSGNVVPAPHGTAGSGLYVSLDGIRFATF